MSPIIKVYGRSAAVLSSIYATASLGVIGLAIYLVSVDPIQSRETSDFLVSAAVFWVALYFVYMNIEKHFE